LARVYLAQNYRNGAIEVLESVPDRSSQYIAAQMAAITTRTRAVQPQDLAERDLLHASQRLERLRLDAERRHMMAIEVLRAAHEWVRAGKPAADPGHNGNQQILGCELTERELRLGLENAYRSLARLAGTPDERIALVDKANEVRPRTLT
jgi:serine/threonine-protein kinase PknG